MVGKESQGKHDVIDPFILQELPEVLPPEPEIQGNSVVGRDVWLSQLVSNGERLGQKM